MEILYEDRFLTVINKPEGLLCVPYPGSHERTALDELCEIRRKRGMVRGSYRPAVVHRLDKATSGVMMFALTPDIKKRIMDNWQSVVTNRLYHAVAENPAPGSRFTILDDSGTIDLPLVQNDRHHSYVYIEDTARKEAPSRNQNDTARYTTARRDAPRRDNHHHGRQNLGAERYETQHPDTYNNRKRFQPEGEILPAITHYKVLQRGSRYTLFELELETGRTNQIRAHLSYLGYPLAGDKTYKAQTDPIRRLCLHARTLEFIHPVTGEKLRFEVPENENWAKLTSR